MNVEQIAKALKELGHVTRLSIYHIVVKAGKQGTPVGDIQEKLNVPNSTLSHHISRLASADLIFQRREGRTLYCVAKYDTLSDVVGYLHDECCIDE